MRAEMNFPLSSIYDKVKKKLKEVGRRKIEGQSKDLSRESFSKGIPRREPVCGTMPWVTVGRANRVDSPSSYMARDEV